MIYGLEQVHSAVERSLAEAMRNLPVNSPRVTGVRHRFGQDHDGDEAVFVTVVLGDDVPEDQIGWPTLGPISTLMSEAVQRPFASHQFMLDMIPYVDFLTETEARERGIL
jgi:hypothetical protein